MKSHKFEIPEHFANDIFNPIRSRLDALEILLRAVKLMINPLAISNSRGTILLHVEKMSRLFFGKDGKVFSLNLPFYVNKDDGPLSFHHDDLPIDAKATSMLLGAINQIRTGEDLYSVYEDLLLRGEVQYWSTLCHMLYSEDGYLRYDFDPSRACPQKHPLHHIDVFYASSTTFKIGLKNGCSIPDLVDIVNIRTDCKYLY